MKLRLCFSTHISVHLFKIKTFRAEATQITEARISHRVTLPQILYILQTIKEK